MQTNKIETYVGIALLLIAVLAFLFILIFNLPKNSAVQSQAQLIPAVPSDLFSSSSSLNKSVQQLSVPANVPAAVNNSDLGRSNVWTSF